MSVSSRSLDRFATTFDHEGLVANAGLILAASNSVPGSFASEPAATTAATHHKEERNPRLLPRVFHVFVKSPFVRVFTGNSQRSTCRGCVPCLH